MMGWNGHFSWDGNGLQAQDLLEVSNTATTHIFVFIPTSLISVNMLWTSWMLSQPIACRRTSSCWNQGSHPCYDLSRSLLIPDRLEVVRWWLCLTPIVWKSLRQHVLVSDSSESSGYVPRSYLDSLKEKKRLSDGPVKKLSTIRVPSSSCFKLNWALRSWMDQKVELWGEKRHYWWWCTSCKKSLRH